MRASLAALLVSVTATASAACGNDMNGLGDGAPFDARRDAQTTDARVVDAIVVFDTGGGRDTGSVMDVARDTPADVGATDVPPPRPDVPIEPPFDSGSCAAGTLMSAMVVTPIAQSAQFAAPTSTGGVVVLAGGMLHRLTGTGGALGAAIPVATPTPYGLAASPDRYAVLYTRDSDILALAVYDLAGTRIADTVLLGGVPHTVTNNEWFGPLIRAGRVTWTGTSWGTYFTVQRLWPDGVAHYGDSLRTLRADGTPQDTRWGWGCSHSMEVRLTSNPGGLGPLCVSDCYPGKGVYFDHNTLIHTDPSGNCAGSIDTHLGGIAPVAGGFVLAFRSPAGRTSNDAAVVRVGDDHTRGTIHWLTSGPGAATSIDVARLGDGVLAGWTVGSQGYLQRVDAAGAPVGTPEMIAGDVLSGASEFFTFSNGDAGWVTGAASGGSGGRLVRVRFCR